MAPNFWLFQSNPKVYNLAENLKSYEVGDEDGWDVTQFRNEMKPGDGVVLWVAGTQGGIYALGELTGTPRAQKSNEGKDFWEVSFRYTNILDKPISRDTVRKHPILRNMQVMKIAIGTNKRVTEEEWNALQALIANDTEGTSVRIWKISAGEGGKYWREFREQGTIGIGFNEYFEGDLTQFDSRDTLLTAIGHNKYVTDQLWTVREVMREGDIMVAYGGRAIKGWGRISGPYQFKEDPAFPYHHRRPVRWESVAEVPTAKLSPTLQRKLQIRATIIELTQGEYQEIIGGRRPEPSINLSNALSAYYASKGYRFPPDLLATFVTALQTKGFVILSGLSGTGKTKLAQLMADLLPDPEETETFVSVRPDWRDSKSLLGYFNPLTGTYDDTRFLQFLLQVKAHYDKAGSEALPHFVILDEMNLARVEYYFADFLSVLESGRDAEKGYTVEEILLHNRDPQATLDSRGRPVPNSLPLPPNLCIVGTVNMDETTHAFSPKVLDRAFTIEFNEVDFSSYPSDDKHKIDEVQRAKLQQALLVGFQRGGKFAQLDKDEVSTFVQANPDYRDHLQVLTTCLSVYDLHFGYRVFDEIMQFMAIAAQGDLFDDLDTAFDVAVLMKVLPKFNGPRSRLRQPLETVVAWAQNPTRQGLKTLPIA